MKDRQDPLNPNLQIDSDIKHNSREKIRTLLTLVIVLSLLCFALGGALLTLFITKIITIDIRFGENSSEPIPSIPTPSPSSELSPTPPQKINQSPSLEITPSPSPEQTSTSSPQPPSTSSNSLEVQGLNFELQGCTKSNISTTNQSISCSVLITSKRENTELSLYSYSSGDARSRIVESGEEYLANRVEFGKYSGQSPSNSLLKDIPMKATFVFDEIPLTLSKMEVLEISAYLNSSYYRDHLKIEFRDIILNN